MKNTLILHDLNAEEWEEVASVLPENGVEFSAYPEVKHCIGCFGCWVKTPGRCVIKDRASKFPGLVSQSRELVIISRNVYGGFSPAVKKVLDRSIGYLMPYFRIVNGEMHHTMRYDNPFSLTVYFYGDSTEKEKELARQLIRGNAVNLGAVNEKVNFVKSLQELKGEAF